MISTLGWVLIRHRFALKVDTHGVSALLSLVGYMAAHQRPDAALVFQTIVDHRAILVSDPIGAAAHLQLGRAVVLWEMRRSEDCGIVSFPSNR